MTPLRRLLGSLGLLFAVIALVAAPLGAATDAGVPPASIAKKKGKCKGKKKGKAAASKKGKKCKGSGKGGGGGGEKPGNEKGTTSIVLTTFAMFSGAQDQITGSVNSNNDACEAGRQLVFFREAGTTDVFVGNHTALFGGMINYLPSNQPSFSQLYATAAAVTTNGVDCAAATSNLITRSS